MPSCVSYCVGRSRLVRRRDRKEEVRIVAAWLACGRDPMRKERQRARVREPIAARKKSAKVSLPWRRAMRCAATSSQSASVESGLLGEGRDASSTPASSKSSRIAATNSARAAASPTRPRCSPARREIGRAKLCGQPLVSSPIVRARALRRGVLRLERAAGKDEGVGCKGAARAATRQIDLQRRANEDDRRRQAHIAHERIASCQAVAKTSRCR